MQGKTPLVFVPGFKGCVLVDPQGTTAWLTGTQVLGFPSRSLALPLLWRNGLQQRDSLSPQEVLRKITIIPYLLETQLYGPWLETASRISRPFYPFAYDWRRDNRESVAQLEALIESVMQSHGGKQVQVVAHSMGGLLTLALLNRRPDLFQSVVFAGVPFAGGIGFLPDLHSGTAVGLNRKLLAPEVLFTFPSLYTLFPIDGSGLEDAHGHPVNMDFYSVDGWKNNALGIFSEQRDNLADLEGYLTQALTAARSFRGLLRPLEQTYPPIAVLAGRNFPTLARAMRGGPRSIRGLDFETPPKEPGDGRVRESSALPPSGIPYRIVYSDREHTQLLNDPVVTDLIENLARAQPGALQDR